MGIPADLAASMAIVGSLLVTSGFVQAASRKGASYLSQGYVEAARRSVGRIIGAGMLVVIGSAGLFALLALTMTWLPADEVVLVAVTYVTLSTLWLAAGVLFLLNQILWYGIGLAIGIGLSLSAMWAGGRAGLSRRSDAGGRLWAWPVRWLSIRGALRRGAPARRPL